MPITTAWTRTGNTRYVCIPAGYARRQKRSKTKIIVYGVRYISAPSRLRREGGAPPSVNTSICGCACHPVCKRQKRKPDDNARRNPPKKPGGFANGENVMGNAVLIAKHAVEAGQTKAAGSSEFAAARLF